MTKFSEEIIEKIKHDHIVPVARWHFLLKNYVFWGFFVTSVLLGSLSFGVIVHVASAGDFDIWSHLKGNILTSTVMMLPYFWLFFLGIFALVAFYNWKHTRIGYRFKRRWIFLGSIVASVIFGNIFYVAGFGGKIDALMTKSFSAYSDSKNKARLELWQQPEDGLIIGKVVDVNADSDSLVIQDSNGDNWSIGNEATSEIKKETVKSSIKTRIKGDIVKVVGEKSGERSFVAREIRSCRDCGGGDDDYGRAESDGDGDNNNSEDRFESHEGSVRGATDSGKKN